MPRCMAIVSGRRCSRGSTWTMPVTFQWDPVKGTGVEGPDLCLCWQHGSRTLDKPNDFRLRVVGGWYGKIWNAEAKVWTVLTTVHAHPKRHFGSKKWWRFRRECRSGDMRKSINYDEARRVA